MRSFLKALLIIIIQIPYFTSIPLIIIVLFTSCKKEKDPIPAESDWRDGYLHTYKINYMSITEWTDHNQNNELVVDTSYYIDTIEIKKYYGPGVQPIFSSNYIPIDFTIDNINYNLLEGSDSLLVKYIDSYYYIPVAPPSYKIYGDSIEYIENWQSIANNSPGIIGKGVKIK